MATSVINNVHPRGLEHTKKCSVFKICLSSQQMYRLLPRHICFLVSAEAIKFLGILKKYIPKNKIYFCFKREKKCSAK